MSPHADFGAIAHAFLGSPYFWSQTLPLFAVALACLAGLVLIARRALKRARARGARQHGPRDLLRGEGGSAEAMDFVLTFPIALLLLLVFVQLMLGLHASLVVHYAAYSAARAARAAYWDITPNDIVGLQAASNLVDNDTILKQKDMQTWRLLLPANETNARNRALTAARLAIMAGIPSAQQPTAGVPAASAGATMYRSVVALKVRPGPALNKAGYAYNGSGLKVSIAPADRFVNKLNTGLIPFFGGGIDGLRVAALPVRATVSYAFPLRMPVARYFGTRGADGRYYRVLSAQAEVL
jgi:hypothetical protein